jgi:hypothetical protein
MDWTRAQRVFNHIEPIAFGWFTLQGSERSWEEQVGAGFFGVVGDVRAWANAPPSLMLYRPYQQTAARAMGWILRTSLDPRALGPAVERTIHALDNEQPITFLRPLAEDFVNQIYPQRGTAIGLVPSAGWRFFSPRLECSARRRIRCANEPASSASGWP